MKSSLLAGLDEDQKKEVIASFRGARTFRRQLVKTLKNKIENERKTTSSKKFLSEPNWNLQMASSLAFERSYRDIINFLEEDEK